MISYCVVEYNHNNNTTAWAEPFCPKYTSEGQAQIVADNLNAHSTKLFCYYYVTIVNPEHNANVIKNISNVLRTIFKDTDFLFPMFN